MHVLLVPSWYPDDNRPLNGSFFREQALMLRDSGMTVGVIALEPVSAWQYRPGLSICHEDGMTVIRGSLPTVPRGLLPGEALMFRLLSRRAQKRYVDSTGIPDVVHAHSVWSGAIVAQAIASRLHRPWVVTEHRPSSLERYRWGWRYRAIASAVRRAHRRIAVSTPFAEMLALYYDTDMWAVCPNPVPDDLVALCNPETVKDPHDSTVIFCHVSHLDDNKRIEMTMEAFARLAHKDPHVSLRIVGGDRERLRELHVLAHSLKIDKNVTFYGRLPHCDSMTVMDGSDAFVLASATESAGVVFAEAQMCGLPSIATRTWGGREAIDGATGMLVDIDDVDQLAEAFATMTKQIRDRRSQGSAQPQRTIREHAEKKYSEARFTNFLGTLYRSLQ
ncbi:glycosyltransferase [Actinomyces vulturis]|uniref:glycosyltransferase n=1 Tax=Actinomyces vulturis TaxID=1857645 RepID=UPI00082A3486|nr:glycosyltransferase [Actinomyces vulturis]